MPPLPQSTKDLYETLQQYQLLLLVAGRRLWRAMLPGDFDGSWARIAPQMTLFTAGAQLAAARAAVEYVPRVLEETNQPDEPLASVRPQAFSGVAADGRSLAGLLAGSVVAAKRAATRGLDGGDALKLGERWLEQALQTAVTDAARDATAAAIAARPGLGWVRIANPPCCSRCAVLAGSFYRWNEPNPRHPKCDCVTQPVSEADAGAYIANPADLLRRGQITDLTRDQRERLADGANLNRVLNESRDRWRQTMAADRRPEGDARRQSWGPNGNEPPPGTTIHQLLDRLTSQVDAARAMRAAGIAD